MIQAGSKTAGHSPRCSAPASSRKRAAWHAWWQSQRPRTLADRADYRSAGRSFPTRADVADIQADLEETRRLALLLSRSGLRISLSGQASMLGSWLEQQAPPPPPARSAEPYRELRAAMRLAALAGETFNLPQEVPRRLVAEMAFEEAELTALRIPETASRLFLTSAVAYRVAGDPLGESLARLSLLVTGYPDDGQAVTRPDDATELASEALGALSLQMPTAAAAMLRRPGDAGPWRNWAPDGRTETGWAQAVREAAELTAERPVSAGTAATALAPPAARFVPAAQAQPGALPSGPAAAGASPPTVGSVPAAKGAEPSGRLRIGVAVLAACLLAGLGALGVFTLLSVATHPVHPGTNPAAHPTLAAETQNSPASGRTATAAVTGTASAPPATRPASTAPASTAPASTLPASTTTPATTKPATTLPATESAGHPAFPGSAESPLPWVVAVIAGLAALAALLGWYLPKIIRLARGRGVGAARLGTLLFTVRLASLPVLHLQVRPRPWPTAPPRARVVRWLIGPGGWLAKRYPLAGWFGHFTVTTESGGLSRAERVRWDEPRPRSKHGHGGAGGGVLRSASSSTPVASACSSWPSRGSASLP